MFIRDTEVLTGVNLREIEKMYLEFEKIIL